MSFPNRSIIVSISVLAALLIITPRQGTLYAIAASEVGERIAATPAVQDISKDALSAVRSWIKSQVAEDKK